MRSESRIAEESRGRVVLARDICFLLVLWFGTLAVFPADIAGAADSSAAQTTDKESDGSPVSGQNQSPQGGGNPPSQINTEPVDWELSAQSPNEGVAKTVARRTELNLLGQVAFASGESRPSENVPVTPIDNNVLREVNTRIGLTATALSEFQVDQNYFAAEYGGRVKPTLHLSPSRVSQIHGSVYESHNDSIFSARSFFQVGEVQPARENDYGFTLGLPLWRSSTLFVHGSQQKVRGSLNANVLVPAADERTPLTIDPETREFVKRILSAYPDQLPNRTDINPRALNANAPQEIDTTPLGVRLDQPLGDKDRLSFGYQFLSQTVDAFNLVGGQNPDIMTKSHESRITWTRSWSSSTTTDFSVGFDRVASLLMPDDTAIGPSIDTGFALQPLGPSPDIPLDRAENHFRYAGQLRRVRGSHNWTVGFEVLRRQINGVESQNHRGTFTFRRNFGRDAITNLRLGAPSSYRVALGNAHRGFRNWGLQYFVGDKWRVSANLTLDLGLRYQLVTRPSEVNDLSHIPYDCDCNNLAPRFGFAYRLGGRWGVLRGAYGIHYGEIFPVTYGQERLYPPSSFSVQVIAPNLANPLGGLRLEDLDLNARSSIIDLDANLVAPYSHQYNFTWELTLVKDWKLDFGYVGSRSHRLLTSWYLNRARLVPGIPLSTRTINQRRPDQRFFDVRRVLNGSRGYYDAGKVTLTIPRWKGLSLDASYWFSKSIDLGSDYTNTASMRDGRFSKSPSEFDTHSAMKGLSDFDQPHGFLWRMNYETPRLAGQNGWRQKIVGQWQFTTVVLLKSGAPFTVVTGSDAPGLGNVDGQDGDRPNVEDPSILSRTLDNPDTSRQMLPRSAFSFLLPTDQSGNLGRNTFRKDGIGNVNAAISRRWPLGAEKALLFRAESINFFNSPQFAAPGRYLLSSDFGQITSTLNNGRTFRFLLRFSF